MTRSMTPLKSFPMQLEMLIGRKLDQSLGSLFFPFGTGATTHEFVGQLLHTCQRAHVKRVADPHHFQRSTMYFLMGRCAAIHVLAWTVGCIIVIILKSKRREYTR